MCVLESIIETVSRFHPDLDHCATHYLASSVVNNEASFFLLVCFYVDLPIPREFLKLA